MVLFCYDLAQAIVLRSIVYLQGGYCMQEKVEVQKSKRKMSDSAKEAGGEVTLYALALLILGAPQLAILRFEGMEIVALIGIVDLFLYSSFFLLSIYVHRDNPLLCKYQISFGSPDSIIAIRDGMVLTLATIFLAQYSRGKYLLFYLVWFLGLCLELTHMERIGKSITLRDAIDLKVSSEEALLNRIARRNNRKDWRDFTLSIKEALEKDSKMYISLAHCPVPDDGEFCLEFEFKQLIADYWCLNNKSFDRILSILSIIPPDDLVFFCIEYSSEDSVYSDEDSSRSGEGSVFCKTYGCGKEEYFVKELNSMQH